MSPVPEPPSQGIRRFALVRYFTLAGLIFTALIVAAVSWIYDSLTQRDLKMLAEDRSVAMASAFSNSLWPRLAPLVEASHAASPDELRAIARREQLHAAVVHQMRGTSVINVKVYSPDGVVAFATDPAQIGNSGRDHPRFRAAVEGRPVSDIRYRNSGAPAADSFGQIDVLSVFLPIFNERRQTVAILEIYCDISDLVQRTTQTRAVLLAAVVVMLGLLFAVLYLLAVQAQATIDAQARNLVSYLQEIGALDQNLRQRNETLSSLNASLHQEIAERRTVEERLMLASTVFDNTAEGITITDSEQKILAVNRAFTQITGYTADEAIGKTPSLLSSGQHDAAFYAELWASIRNTGRWQGEIVNRRKNGEIFPEWLSISAVRNEQSNTSHYVAVFSDITAIKASQARLEQLASRDSLTELPNRLLFSARVDHAIAHAHRLGQRLAVIILDLDHFQHVNDTLGHEAGDQILRQVAEALQARLNEDDTLARLGGDEFCVLLEQAADPGDVARQAHRLLSAFEKPFRLNGHELFITASVGIALYPDDGTDVATVIKHADTAMFQAKTHGRNAFHFYEPEMTAVAVERLNTESLLRRCVANKELLLYYQPQVDLLSGEIVGAEALVRWQHPSKGLLLPMKFIPIAEESGLISMIGAWVLRESCRQLASWRGDGLLLPRVAVNVSAKQLERGDFVDLVHGALGEFSLPPECLEIELTESTIMNTDNAFDVLDELRRIGVELAIDDFGTGHSSLALLKRLPIGKLKIDRSFITEISRDPQDLAIVRSVIALAATMELSTVAEGVEDPTQIVFLKEEGCGQIQGFVISEPLPPEKMTALLIARSAQRGVTAGAA